MPRSITASTTLDNLKKEAKRWLGRLRAQDEAARERFTSAFPEAPGEPGLRDVQHALAREYGYQSWVALTRALAERAIVSSTPERLQAPEQYERLANDWMLAFNRRDDAARDRLNAHYHRAFGFDDLAAEIWRRVYAFRQRSSRVATNTLLLDEAQTLLAQDAGFANWPALIRAAATGAPPIPAYAVDLSDSSIGPRRRLSDREWEALVAQAREQRTIRIHGQGLVSDRALARIVDLESVIALDLSGSREVTDEGLRLLARMPQLERLNLTGMAVTDRGLEVLRQLPRLRHFVLTWSGGVSDEGLAHLAACEHLERVDVMGSRSGDGLIRALQAKPKLGRLSTGRLVTNEGLRLLHGYPLFKKWTGPYPSSLERGPDGPQLLIDGPFTDDGLASLSGLDGVAGLDLFWNASAITSDGLAHLAGLANLESIGADGQLSDDVAMRHYAALPRLRRLRAQGTIATDAGFESLSRSSSLEFLWTRETPNLGSRGFIALSKLPALRRLGVSCKNVDDRALSTLALFPRLEELTPIDVTDPGFAHIGQCRRLERLECMYCRDTTDVATAHIARLRLKKYYAGLTQVTDRSLEILGSMTSLEQFELYECRGVTNEGLKFLGRLPRLREVQLDALPGVTFEGTRVFPARVRVRYST